MEKVLYKCTTSPLALKKRLYLRGSGKDSKDENQRFCHKSKQSTKTRGKPSGREGTHGEGNKAAALEARENQNHSFGHPRKPRGS